MTNNRNQDPNALAEMAEAALGRNDFPDAEKLANRALSLDPLLVSARVVLGFVAAQTGKPAVAIEYLQEAIVLDSTLWGPRTALAALTRMQGEPLKAIPLWQEALAMRPDDSQGWFELGRCYFDLGQFSDAGGMIEKAIKLESGNANYRALLGFCLESVGQVRKALQAYFEATSLQPDEPLATARLHEISQATISKEREAVPKTDAITAEGLFWLGKLQFEAGDAATADQTYQLSLERDPESARVMTQYALMMMQMGRFDEGSKMLEDAIRIDPTSAKPYAVLVKGRKFTKDDGGLLNQMEGLLTTLTNLEERSVLLGALGKAYNDLQQYETAMRCFDEGHAIVEERLQQGGKAFDQRAYKVHIDQVLEVFGSKSKQWAGRGQEGDLSVFVIGMIRSGTTLTEQILSSHSQIGGAGEMFYWVDRFSEYCASYQSRPADTPLKEWGASYQQYQSAICPGKARVTDKQPGNFLISPLIHSCLPDSHFVHCRRNPVDTCISIYTTPDLQGLDWRHKKENVVFVYKQYLRVMDAWRQVLPEGSLLEVDYDSLVSDSENVVRQMIAFIGLDWDPNCLRHEQNMAPIVTPSMWQARQPVYKSSVERWRKYSDVLGAFDQLL